MALFDMSQIKNDSGALRTQSLFYELSYDNPEHVIFTFKEDDIELPSGKKAHSLRLLYLARATSDPTEYEFALAVFGSWDVWQRLSKAPKIRDQVKKWRSEAAVRRKAMAFASVVSEVQEGGKSSFTAAKYLIEEPWKVKDARTTDGRKARKDAQETAEEAFERAAVSDDLKRLKREGLIQ